MAGDQKKRRAGCEGAPSDGSSFRVLRRNSNSSDHGTEREGKSLHSRITGEGALSPPRWQPLCSALARLWYTLEDAGRPSGDASTHAESGPGTTRKALKKCVLGRRRILPREAAPDPCVEIAAG